MNSLSNSFPNHRETINSFAIEFNPKDFTAVLQIKDGVIKLANIENTATRFNLIPKRNFHFTIIGSITGKKILELLANYKESERKNMIIKIEELLHNIKWSAELQEEYYYLTKNYIEEGIPDEKRESIIQLAILNGLDRFYNELNKIFKTEFAVPFPHLTLFTNSTREDKKSRGIGIYSKRDFDNFEPLRIK